MVSKIVIKTIIKNKIDIKISFKTYLKIDLKYFNFPSKLLFYKTNFKNYFTGLFLKTVWEKYPCHLYL